MTPLESALASVAKELAAVLQSVRDEEAQTGEQSQPGPVVPWLSANEAEALIALADENKRLRKEVAAAHEEGLAMTAQGKRDSIALRADSIRMLARESRSIPTTPDAERVLDRLDADLERVLQQLQRVLHR